MPATVNGIGTHYYGSGNASAVQGTCGSCGREATLSSYDTRLWFVIIFIPILPLWRYRIMDDCSLCRVHRRITIGELEASLAQKSEGLEARWKQGDREAGIELGAALVGHERFDRAREHLRELVLRHPDDADANGLAAAVFAQTGRAKEATPYFEAAVRLERGAEKPLVALALHYLDLKRWADAERTLVQLLELKPGHPAYLHELANAVKQQGRAEDAAKLYDALFAVAPDAKKDPKVLEAAIAAKKSARVALSADEASHLASRRGGRLKVAAVLLVVAGLIAGGVLFFDHKVNVLLDNTSGAPAQLELDGAPWTSLGKDEWKKVTVARGAHTIVARSGARVETFDVTVDPPLFENVEGGLFLADVFQGGLYFQGEVTYGDRAPAQPEPRVHAGARWTWLRSIQDLFTDPPQSQMVKRGQTVTRRWLHRVPNATPEQVIGTLLRVGRGRDAVPVAKAALERAPDDLDLVHLLVQAGDASQTRADVDAWIATKRSADPKTIHFHRVHQESLSRAGKRDEAGREYADFAEKNPASALARYLSGRVAPTAAEATSRYKKALELDQGFAYAHLALGFQLEAAGRFEEAVAETEAFVERQGGKPEDAIMLWGPLGRARRWNALRGVLLAWVSAPPAEAYVPALDAWGRLLIVTGASDAEWKKWRGPLEKDHGKNPWLAVLEVQRARWQGDAKLAARSLAASHVASVPGPQALNLGVGIALDEGHLAEAEKPLEVTWTKGAPATRPLPVALALAATALAQGDKDLAAKWGRRVAESTPDPELADLGRFLEGKLDQPALDARDFHRSPDRRALTALARAVRLPEGDERDAQLDLAVRLAAPDLGEAAFVARRLARSR